MVMDSGLAASRRPGMTGNDSNFKIRRTGDLQRPSGGRRAAVHGDVAFRQAATNGLFAAVRGRHDAERSVGKVAAFLAEPQ